MARGRKKWRPAFLSGAAIALALAGTAPVAAQVITVVEYGGVAMSVENREAKALQKLGDALRSSPGAQESALAAARRAAKGPDALHWLALLELELGRLRKDDALRASALDRLIASPRTSPEKMTGYLDVRGGIAFKAGDLGTARSHWTRLLALKPNDPDVLGNLAQVRVAQGDSEGAAGLLEQAVAEREKSGARASAASYRQRLTMLQKGPVGAAAAAGRALVGAYPTPAHWREALVVYRQLAAPTGGQEIDLLRLMRTVGALARTDEYLRMAQLLRQAGQAAEAKKVLAEGQKRGLVDPAGSPAREIVAEVERELPRERARLASAPQADSLAGAGRYAEAEARYRAALAAGKGDPGEINARLGMALVQAGRRSEAESAFREAAKTGRYSDLAQFWLLWLAQGR
jgi:tetratricopeptide (TPR) repeat protein